MFNTTAFWIAFITKSMWTSYWFKRFGNVIAIASSDALEYSEDVAPALMKSIEAVNHL